MERPRNENGAIALITALTLTLLMLASALVLDFGLVRVDRQIYKSAADAATQAGLHALTEGKDTSGRPFAGVCTAMRYLKQNNPRFTNVDQLGAWTDGNGTAKANGCTDLTLKATACIPGDKTTWARYTWAEPGGRLQVIIQSGYLLSGSGFTEENLAAVQADNTDQAQGCDQLAVIITQRRKPGFGSLATSTDLVSAIRTVGRVKLGPGSNAPAMLLLKQSGCGILSAGSAAGGSFIHVFGAASANGLTQPGTIHSDSSASGCSNNQNLFTGNAANGIEAGAAPLLSNQTQADPTKPGLITAFAATLGLSGTVLRDNPAWVCGSTGLLPAGTCPGNEVSGRSRIYRAIVDTRYLGAVTGMKDDANTAFAAASGYTKFPAAVNTCKPTQADVDALNLTSTSSLFVDCTTNAGFVPNGDALGNLTINAGTIVFAGSVNPAKTLSMPNASRVYITGANGDALAPAGLFSMHTKATDGYNNVQAGLCKNTESNGHPNDKAVLVVKNGSISFSNGATLQLCNTTVLMMGGRTDACLPTAPANTAPNPSTPCGGGTGTGQLKQTGGNVDWTAPNRYDVTTLADGSTDPAKKPEYEDKAGPEDLAFWSESGGTSGNPKYQMTGGGSVHLVGVLMVPNAEPFNLSGQFTQTLVNAQYIVSSLDLSSNNTGITMKVDPNSAVTVPELRIVGLVR